MRWSVHEATVRCSGAVAGNLDEVALYRGALDPAIFRQHYLVAIVPEPGTCLLLGGGLLALLRRRRRRS